MEKLPIEKYNAWGELAVIAMKVNEIIDRLNQSEKEGAYIPPKGSTEDRSDVY